MFLRMNNHRLSYDRRPQAGAGYSHDLSTEVSEADLAPESDASVDEREDADLMNEVIMAVDMRDGGSIGCSFYVAKEEKLALLPDVRGGGLEIIDARMAKIVCNHRFAVDDIQ